MNTRDDRDLRDVAADRRVEWLLRERVGGEQPPDLTAEVMSKLRDRDAITAADAVPTNPRRHLYAAALVVLGIGAVLGTVLWSQPPRDPKPAIALQDPQPHTVRSREDIEALPADARYVIAEDLEDDDLPALARLQSLERLELRAMWVRPKGMGLRPAYVSVTDDGLLELKALPRLRVLELVGQIEVKGPGLAPLASAIPLRELRLRQIGVDDASLVALAGLPLHTLKLEYCQDFGDRALRAIANCQTLRELSLRGCNHLDDSSIAQLGSLRKLEKLDLYMIGSRTMFSGIRLSPLPEPAPGSGVNDRAMAGLATLTALKELDIGTADVSRAGLQHLTKLPIERLSLGSVHGLTSQDLTSLPQSITSLNLLGGEFDVQLGAVLGKRLPRLRTLNLQSCDGIGDASLPGILAIPSLRELDLSYCKGFTVAAVPELVKSAQLESLNLKYWKFLDAAMIERIRAMPSLRRLETDDGVEELDR